MDGGLILRMIRGDDWQQYAPLLERLQQWPQWDTALDAMRGLNRDALYESPVHGVGHIERTMLLGALCAMLNGLDRTGTELVMNACAYHDVGRKDDRYDTQHGYESSLRIGELTGKDGYELQLLRAAVTAHSRRDPDFLPTLSEYGLDGDPLCLTVSRVLKDADGLDRVRVNDLDIGYMRLKHSAELADFSHELFVRYQRHLGLEPIPLYPAVVIEMVRRVFPERADHTLLWDRRAFFETAREAYRMLQAKQEQPDLPEPMLRFFGLI